MAMNFNKIFKNNFDENDSVNGEFGEALGLRIIRPRSFGSETSEITKLIKKKNIVAFNLENLSSEDGQRTLDFITGATMVLGGRIEKITDKVYASVPSGISVESLEISQENIED